jgi:hypothetical protein
VLLFLLLLVVVGVGVVFERLRLGLMLPTQASGCFSV